MARRSTNKPASRIEATGTGDHGKFFVTDLTDSSTPIATLSVIDKDRLEEYRHNILSTEDERFEIRDGMLYLREGVTLEPGRVELSLVATDEFDPSIQRVQTIRFDVQSAPFAAAAGETLHLFYDGDYSISVTGRGDWIVSHGDESMTVRAHDARDISRIELAGGGTDLTVAAALVDGRTLHVGGDSNDSFNVDGVTFTESSGGVSMSSSVDIHALDCDATLLVNGSRTDAFKAMWDYLDDAYAYLQSHWGNTLVFGLNGYTESEALPEGMIILGETTNGAAALAVNEAVTRLDIAYAQYLHDGGSADDLVDFIAKTNILGTREQTMHDNLLGSVSAANIGDRNFPDDVEQEFINSIPGDFGSRPYASGNLDAYGHTDAGTNLAKAWDYAHGFDRPDYVTHFTGPVDSSATQDNGEMWFGDGNPSTGWTIGIHDGAGVEFGLNVHYRTGDQIEGHLADDGLVHFDAPAGHQMDELGHNVQGDSLSRSATSFDFAFVTGLNGTDGTVTDFTATLAVDFDPSEATNFKVFTLTEVVPGVTAWVASDDSFLGGDEGYSQTYNENSANFGFTSLLNEVRTNAGDVPAGTYDVVGTVYDGDGGVLLTNHIVLDLFTPELG